MNPSRGSDRITPAALACVAASAAHLWHQPLWPLLAYALCALMAMFGLLLGGSLGLTAPGFSLGGSRPVRCVHAPSC
jgi:hypothetical protein